MTTDAPNDGGARSRWARHLGVSVAAIDLLCANEVIDLHVDSFIWTRLFGYDLLKKHGQGPLAARFLSQADIPRLREGRVSGSVFVITTNPCRRQRNRLRALVANHRRLVGILNTVGSGARVVTNYREYLAARAAGQHGVFVGIQGGNALSDPASTEIFPLERVLLVTLVHLTNSDLGTTSSPLRGRTDRGLLPRGRDLVRVLESRGTLIDLAHASPQLFWDVVAMHDRSRPLIVSHTGLCGVHRHWRNLDDRQLRAIADSGGVVGILYHGPFLGDAAIGGSVQVVARHLAHGIKTVGPEHLCLGSDWDGLIATPFDMPSCLELPRLVQALLDEQVDESSIAWVLGNSALRLLALARP
jgi:membrane dipeptidase